MLAPPRDAGKLSLIVARRENGRRETPEQAALSPKGGVTGDAWARDRSSDTETQITVMHVDVAQLIANGQPLTLFGDNLMVDLDLSVDNLPPGSRLRLGDALLEVTAKPHMGCVKFRQRFGKDALRLTADPRFRVLRLRGIHARVVEGSRVTLGDSIEILSRG